MTTNTTTTTHPRKPGKKRIMVQVWTKLALAINRDFAALHLKRDRYLNDLLQSEIEELDREVKFRNSDEVRARIQGQKLPNRTKLTLELDDEVVTRIDSVLRDKNIPRDSFINRVLFFLIAKSPILDHLGVAYETKSSASAKPLEDALGFLIDPFFHIRSANGDCFYTLTVFSESTFGPNGPNLFSLNTAITESDWEMLNIDLSILDELQLNAPGGMHATN